MPTDDRPDNKVARLLGEYEREDLGAELEARWTASGEERMSLRDLAEWLNERLLETRLRAGERSITDREVRRTYEALTDADVSGGVRTETRNDLRQRGIDVEALESDFVSYQAIRSYLEEYRGVSYDPDESNPIESVRESIAKLSSRLRSVTRGNVERLDRRGDLSIGSFTVLVSVTVLCEDCGTQYSVDRLFERGRCDCDAGERDD